jgi:hypothetical protein
METLVANHIIVTDKSCTKHHSSARLERKAFSSTRGEFGIRVAWAKSV